MPNVKFLWPHVDAVPGFEDPADFRRVGHLLLCQRWPGQTGPCHIPGTWQGVTDLHDAYEIRSMSESDLEALRVLGLVVKGLSGQGSIALQRSDGQDENIDDDWCVAFSDRWRATTPTAKWQSSSEYMTYCPLVLDDIAIFGARIWPPLAKGPHTEGDPHDPRTCPVRADDKGISHLRAQLLGVQARPRSLPAAVIESVLAQQPMRLVDLSYDHTGNVLFGPQQELLVECGHGWDQPHWCLWTQGDIRSMSDDQNWWEELHFYPTLYRFNTGIEHLAHQAPVNAHSLEDIYAGRASLGVVQDNQYTLLGAPPTSARLSFCAHWINRAVSQITIVTSDDNVVLAKRGDRLDYYPGYWDATIGEGLQPVLAKFDEMAPMLARWPVADRCLVDGVERALREEVQIGQRKNIERIWVTAIGREWSNGNLAVFSTVWLPMTFAEFTDEYKRRFREIEAFCPLPLNRVLDACTQPEFRPEEMQTVIASPGGARAPWTGHARVKLLLTALAHYTRRLAKG